MTDFMTALPVILVQRTCPGDQRAKGVQFQSTCNLCRRSTKTQVWLCFLVLSFFSTYTWASRTADVQICLNTLKQDIEKSDAMLYAPSINDIEKTCENTSLGCYMMELTMVLNEERIEGKCEDCIFDFSEQLLPEANADCPPCEAYSLKNITIFLDRLNTLLEKLTAQERIK